MGRLAVGGGGQWGWGWGWHTRLRPAERAAARACHDRRWYASNPRLRAPPLPTPPLPATNNPPPCPSLAPPTPPQPALAELWAVPCPPVKPTLPALRCSPLVLPAGGGARGGHGSSEGHVGRRRGAQRRPGAACQAQGHRGGRQVSTRLRAAALPTASQQQQNQQPDLGCGSDSSTTSSQQQLWPQVERGRGGLHALCGAHLLPDPEMGLHKQWGSCSLRVGEEGGALLLSTCKNKGQGSAA